VRIPLVVGNWKMNQSLSSVEDFLKNFDITHASVQFGVCPVNVHLSKALECRTSSVLIGAQDCHFNESGAHTGDVSATMIRELGCELVILGHSERRADHNESSQLVFKKTKAAIAAGLTPIVCLGETLEEREAGNTQTVVSTMLKESLSGLSIEEANKIVVAYEPVWAIGTGKTATPEQAQEVHKIIRDLLVDMFNATISNNMRILYGGSVKPTNAAELIQCPDIDGSLVGGASLTADSFSQLIAATAQIVKEES